MIEKLRLWLQAEVNSRLLADPPFSSYAEVAEYFVRLFQSSPTPYALQDDVRENVAQMLLSIIEIRTRKILWELSQGKTPTNLTLEEERLVGPIDKIRSARPHKKKAEDYVVVQFLIDSNSLVTEDFVQIGPFRVGDLAKLSKRDAKELEKKGAARRLSL